MVIPKDLIITFPFEPIPCMRMTQGQVKLMRIPDAKLPLDKVQLKNRIRRQEQFKFAMATYAKSAKFTFPECGCHIMFYIETDKKDRWGKPHQMKPDADNLVKLLKDSLMKDDSRVWDYRITKYWCEPKKGRTEIWA